MVATLATRKDIRSARKLPFGARRVTTVAPAGQPEQPEQAGTAGTPLTPERDVKAMLRDIAIVLHLTKKVKAEILADREAALAAE